MMKFMALVVEEEEEVKKLVSSDLPIEMTGQSQFFAPYNDNFATL